ncbi:MAG: isoprenyl transferase [Clostridiales bacterium]|nr:isoprenyl transferase [Clostridiales bacterium]
MSTIKYPLPPEVDPARLPRHIAVIMDGNGRWAKKNKLKVALGHRAGTENLREIIRNCSDIGVEALTLYAFSTENWNRSQTEVEALMQLILDFFHSEIDELDQKNVRILILGDKSGLPGPQRQVLEQAEARTAANTGLSLNIAVNYGGRAELVRAAQLLAREVQSGLRTPESIDEAAFAGKLYTAGLPEVDLLIRTSGEMRLSNFLLYQCSYAEFVFPEELWPDFHVPQLHRCIAEFQSRSRRYGGREE